MENIDKKLATLKDVREHGKKYYPIVDHVWESFPARAISGENNIGWDVGVLAGNRPYFAECWEQNHRIMTYYISVKDFENATLEELEKMLSDAGVIRYKEPEKHKTSLRIYRDFSRNKFYSINYIISDEDGVYADNVACYEFDKFNELNRKTA